MLYFYLIITYIYINKVIYYNYNKLYHINLYINIIKIKYYIK